MSTQPIRQPAVAGRFYPGDPSTMRTAVEALYAAAAADMGAPPGSGERRAPQLARAVIVPHAGWVYSGETCAKVLAQTTVPETVIVLCPNHTGRGENVAVFSSGAWQLPDGEIAIDANLAELCLRELPSAKADRLAHAGEHAIEVILPFLRAKNPAVELVPIVVGGLSEAEAIALGDGLARAVDGHTEQSERRVLVIASSDMNHYLSDAECRSKDRIAIDAALSGDPRTLYRAVVENELSVCGYLPITAVLAYGRRQRAAPPALVAYATSGDASGDRRHVVGYAGFVLT